MAKDIRDRAKFQRRKFRKEASLPFTRTNYILLAIGITVVILGFVAMAEGSTEGTLPLVVSPILLVIGYCIIIPLGILYKKKEMPSSTTAQSQEPQSTST